MDFNLLTKSISLYIDRKIYKKVKVLPKISGNLNKRYILGDVKVLPSFIGLSGPKSLVESIESLQTNNISIEKKTGKFVKEISINKQYLKNVTLDVSTVKVSIPIFDKSSLANLKTKIEIRNADNKYQYLLKNEFIKVLYNSENSEIILSNDDIVAYIDVTSVNIEDFFADKSKDYIEKKFLIKCFTKKEGVEIIAIVPDSVFLKIMK